MKKMSVLLGILVLLSMSGCSTYKLVKAITSDEPVIGNRVQVSKENVDDFNKRNGFDKPAPTQPAVANPVVATQPNPAVKAFGKYAAESAIDAVFTDGVDANERVKMIAIGNTKTLIEATPAEAGRAYDNVVRLRAKDGKQVTMTKEWYVANAAAATNIKLDDNVWRKSIGAIVLVPTTLKKAIQFATSGSLFAETGDLVAAEVFEDRGTWITRVLCKKNSPEFEKCAVKYPKGMFQATDGKEIATDYKLVKGGMQIDPLTFEKITSKE